MSGILPSLRRRRDHSEPRPAVLFVLPWRLDAAGGVNRVVLRLVEGFGETTAYRPVLLVNAYPQRKVTRMTQGEFPAFYEYYLPAPFDEQRVAYSLLSYVVRLPWTLGRFIGLIRRENVVAVNLHYPGLSVFTVLLARFITSGAFSVVLSFHGADVPHGGDGGRARRLIWRFILRRSDALVTCSRSLAEELQAADSATGITVHVVHNGIDAVASRHTALQSALPAGLKNRRYLLTVGKFESKKGHDVLIDSFDRIAAAYPDLHLVVIGGSGPMFAALERRVAASPYRERVLLFRDLPHGETLAAISGSIAFTLPSRREPFGVVILEAAVMARPVVASRVGGIPEIIRDGYSGALVPPDDVAALAAALQRMLNDPEGSRAQAVRLQETVALNFTLAAQVRAYQDLLAGLTSPLRTS